MGVNIHARQVRNELLIAIWLRIQNQGALLRLRRAAIALASQEDAQLQRHVETGQLGLSIQLRLGNIVNAVATLLYYQIELFDAGFATIINLSCRPDTKAAGIYREDQCAE